MQFVPLTINQTTAIVPLAKGRFTLIDADAWSIVSLHYWETADDGRGHLYAIGPNGIRLHNLICPPGRGRETDHKNRNTLDNRRQNLRPATRPQNAANSGRKKPSNTGYRGAYWDKNKQKFVAKITHERKLRNIGQFETAEDAARAYDAAAVATYGEFAVTNFPITEKTNGTQRQETNHDPETIQGAVLRTSREWQDNLLSPVPSPVPH